MKNFFAKDLREMKASLAVLKQQLNDEKRSDKIYR